MDKYPEYGQIEYDMRHGGVARIYDGSRWININTPYDPKDVTKSASNHTITAPVQQHTGVQWSGGGSLTTGVAGGTGAVMHNGYPTYQHPQQMTSTGYQQPIAYKSFERFFWDNLVDLGWRAFGFKETGEIEQIVLVCNDCGKSIGKTQMVHTLTKEKMNKLSIASTIDDITRDHKKTAKGCNKPEYTEDGDLVMKPPVASTNLADPGTYEDFLIRESYKKKKEAQERMLTSSVNNVWENYQYRDPGERYKW